MLFNSLQFLVFLFIVTIAYYTLPHRFRWILLFIASAYFYMAFIPEYIIILIFIAGLDYALSLLLERLEGPQRNAAFAAGVIINLGILFSFKYYDFINDNISFLFHLSGFHYSYKKMTLALPLGISFHTFQSLGYLIDVYRRKISPEKHFGRFFVFVMFFPQLVAGPIERAENLLSQLYKNITFDSNNLVEGFERMLYGFFKKVVVADRLSIYTDQVFNSPHLFGGMYTIVAVYFFAFQIYCDFSGYSDIAIGAARILGIDLMENFKRPYFASNIQEFWRRWHISLSGWFRDYLYFPLGGNRVSQLFLFRNIFIVFLLSGLWHGAAWNFVIWGALHGLYMIFYNVLGSYFSFGRKHKSGPFATVLSFFITFHFTLFAWIFFRANSFPESLLIIKHLVLPAYDISGNVQVMYMLKSGIITLLVFLVMEAIQELREKNILTFTSFLMEWWSKNFYTRVITSSVMLLIILFAGVFNNSSFIYFQF